jgi:hypothetical protein
MNPMDQLHRFALIVLGAGIAAMSLDLVLKLGLVLYRTTELAQ